MARRPESLDGSRDFCVADLRDPASLAEAVDGVDVVFHLAARVHDPVTYDDPAIHDETTVQGTRNLLDAAARAGVSRFVYFSSVAVYGSSAPDLCDENVEPQPSSSYGEAKLRAETLVLNAAAAHGWHATVLRAALVYGPGCKGNLMRMIRAVDRRLFPPPPHSQYRRSMIHVADLVRVARLASELPAAGAQRYNVVDLHPMSAREMYDRIVAALGRPTPRWAVPRELIVAAGLAGDAGTAIFGKGFPFNTDTLDRLIGRVPLFIGEKIRRDLGFTPENNLETALPEMILAYRSRRNPG